MDKRVEKTIQKIRNGKQKIKAGLLTNRIFPVHNIKNFKFIGAHFCKVDFSNCSFISTSFSNCSFYHCDFKESKFDETAGKNVLKECRLEDCDFREAWFSQLDVTDTIFKGCMFNNGKIHPRFKIDEDTRFKECSFKNTLIDLRYSPRPRTFINCIGFRDPVKYLIENYTHNDEFLFAFVSERFFREKDDSTAVAHTFHRRPFLHTGGNGNRYYSDMVLYPKEKAGLIKVAIPWQWSANITVPYSGLPIAKKAILVEGVKK